MIVLRFVHTGVLGSLLTALFLFTFRSILCASFVSGRRRRRMVSLESFDETLKHGVAVFLWMVLVVCVIAVFVVVDGCCYYGMSILIFFVSPLEHLVAVFAAFCKKRDEDEKMMG
jgi:hypothetical protein